jgi:Lon-like protease
MSVLIALAYVVPLKAGQVLGGAVRDVEIGVEPGRTATAGRWLLPVAEVGNLTLARWLFAGEAGSMDGAKQAAWSAVRQQVGPVLAVTAVAAGSPASDAGLRAGDVIVAVDRSAPTTERVDGPLSGGRPVALRILRGERVLDLLLVPFPPYPQQPGGGAALVMAELPEEPPRVDTGEVIGTSGGLVLALAELDWLTPGDLTAGLVVAATGSLGPGGTVRPVGAYEAKVGAARDAGAQLFVAPAADAGRVSKAAGRDLAVAGARDLDEAVRVLCAAGGTSSACP